MFDLRKYWEEVRTIERGLAASVWLVSLENRAKGQVGGRMVEATASVAARLLQANSHRGATVEEVQVHESLRQDVEREQFYTRLRTQGIAVVPLK
jgi:hypothetical protein